MLHNCIDWTTNPPTRKLPLLVLTLGEDRVYTSIPKDFKTLEEVTRREFGLANVEVKLYSSCVSLCDGLPARITESVWEHISPYIGCASVKVGGDDPNHDAGRGEELSQARLEPLGYEAKLDLFPEAQDDGRAQAERRLSSRWKPSTAESTIHDHPPSDHEHDDEAKREAPPREEYERPWEEEVSAVPPPRARTRRRVVSDDEDAGDSSDRKDAAPMRSSSSTAISPARPVKKAKEESSHRKSQADLQSGEAAIQPSKPIKQEKRSTQPERGLQERVYLHSLAHTVSQSQPESQPVDVSDNQKLMIRVAHRASKQESKFTTKSSTKVAKVIAGACKSFGLDATQATLYLIVSVDDEDDMEENLFPCDKNDSIASAGAESDTETKFLLKITGDA